MAGNNDDQRFLNFPIKMMQGLITGKTPKVQFINNAAQYGCYWYCENVLEDAEIEFEETSLERFKRACKYLGVAWGNYDMAKLSGERLNYEYQRSKVFVGINSKILVDFNSKKDKSDFEWYCFMAFIALKSIIGKKDYVRSDNEMMYCRMHGKETKKEFRELKNPVIFTRYKRDKIITELQLNWGLKYYADGVKGFYLSFEKNGLNKITLTAEAAKKKNKIERLKKEKELAKQSALQALR